MPSARSRRHSSPRKHSSPTSRPSPPWRSPPSSDGYFYLVTAVDTSANESADSAVVSATPTGGGGGGPVVVWINEFHYDNRRTDEKSGKTIVTHLQDKSAANILTGIEASKVRGLARVGVSIARAQKRFAHELGLVLIDFAA